MPQLVSNMENYLALNAGSTLARHGGIILAQEFLFVNDCRFRSFGEIISLALGRTRPSFTNHGSCHSTSAFSPATVSGDV
jgi:hypothetical protein